MLITIRGCIPGIDFNVSRRRNKKRQSRSLSLVELPAQAEGKRMKRRELLKAGGIGLAASTVAAPAVAQSMPEVRWRLAASWPKSLDTLYGCCEYFCKPVAEITDN